MADLEELYDSRNNILIVDETDVLVSNEVTIRPGATSAPAAAPVKRQVSRANSKRYDTTQLINLLNSSDRVSGREPTPPDPPQNAAV